MPATREIYTLSLHDALPISGPRLGRERAAPGPGSPRRWKPVGGQPAFASGSVVDRKSTRLNSSHRCISYAVFCLKKKILPSIHDVIQDLVAADVDRNRVLRV